VTTRRPVVVLAYGYSGAARIQRLLARSPALACTCGTGLLPACAQAAAAWRQVDNRAGPLSSLALTSIRALASSMISVILAEAGKPRWCEVCFSPPSVGEAFLELYPQTQFLCLHRSWPDFVRAGPGASPGTPRAAIAAYWAERTESLLRFREAHPAACRQVRYEDLAGSPGQEARETFAFLGLGEPAPILAEEEAGDPRGGDPLAGAPLPASHLPIPLAERINELQGRLGYPPISYDLTEK
jgi:hypothetical protein